MPIQVRTIVTEAFMNEWDRLIVEDPERPIRLRRLVPLSENVQENILSKFRLDNVQRNLILEENEDRTKFNKRYHTRNLRNLARIFAQHLYYATNKGASITEVRIEIAHQLLLAEGACEIYPCGGP